MNCGDRERIFEDGSPAEWKALEVHAATCPACAEEVRVWKSLSVAAAELRDYSDSPALWPRIQKSLAEQAASMQPERTQRAWNWESLRASFGLHWQTALAGAAGAAVRRFRRLDRSAGQENPVQRPLVKMLNEVRRSAAHQRAGRSGAYRIRLHARDRQAGHRCQGRNWTMRTRRCWRTIARSCRFWTAPSTICARKPDKIRQTRTCAINCWPCIRKSSGRCRKFWRSSDNVALRIHSCSLSSCPSLKHGHARRLRSGIRCRPRPLLTACHPTRRAGHAPGQQEVSRDFQKTVPLAAGPVVSRRK